MPVIRRYYSTTKAASKKSIWDSTLNLPSTQFPIRPQVNDQLFRKTVSDDLYKAQLERQSNKQFILMDGPPFANGDLHVGTV